MFHFFSKLAPELRHYIWRLSLPDDIGPVLHFYHGKGYWRVRRVEEHRPTYRPGYRDKEMEFRTDLIDPEVQLCLPQFFVNHEAHDIAADWLRQQGGGFVLSPGKGKKMDRFTRPFNAERDPLYIPHDKWDQFLDEPSDRLFECSELVPGVDIIHKAIRFAVPEDIFFDPVMLQCLPEVKCRWFDEPGKLFVILGAQPKRSSPAERASGHRVLWEMEGEENGALVWNKKKRKFVIRQGAKPFDKDRMMLFDRLEDFAWMGLRDSMLENACKTLEIRFVSAVKRQGLCES
ncbi:hypothetical protein E4U39_005617 [Claviceps sp. Clav50 group G5]|nr:hypothetical protein E4U39_005617 [Claviceps sp. Clav50 group G5]